MLYAVNLEGFQRSTLLEKSSSKKNLYNQMPYTGENQVRNKETI